jgi:hypothetical protein
MYQQESAPASGVVTFLTWMTAGILVIVTVAMLFAGYVTVGVPIPISGIFWGMGFFFVIGSVALLWLCWAQKPGLIRVEAGRLIVERKSPWANLEIELGQLQRVEILDKLPKMTWRLFGNGGLFCFSGSFYQRELGKFRASITTLKNLVLIVTLQKTLVITPVRPQELVDFIKSQYSVVPR